MTVTASRVQNFMGFEDSGWIELRPITLLFGRNSSGKSALIRALLLLRQSLESEPGEGALLFVKDDGFDFGDYGAIVRDHDLAREISFWFRLRFRIKNNSEQSDRNEDRILKSTLNAINFFVVPSSVSQDEIPTAQTLTIKIVIGLNPARQPFLRAFEIRDSQDDVLFAATHKVEAQVTDNPWSYATDFFDLHDEENSDIWPFVTVFSTQGFLPHIRLINSANDDPPDEENVGHYYHNCWWMLNGVQQSLRTFLDNLSYLGPLRSPPHRFYYIAGQGIGTPERGKNFVRNLVKADTSLQDAISKWLKISGTPYRLQLQPLDERKTLYELRLQESSVDQQMQVSANIREVGFGITQILPIIAQAVLAQPGDTLIIEQPELHLHPLAQAELGDMFIAMSQRGVHFLIETHSEHLLLRLRRRIAETTLQKLKGSLDLPLEQHSTAWKLETRELSIHFVQRIGEVSITEPLYVNEKGEYAATPEGFSGFFSSDFEEVFKINLAIAKMNELVQNYAPSD